MSDLNHAAFQETPEAFFAPDPLVLPIYQGLEVWLFGLAGVTRVIHKTQISFYARKSFAFAWLPPLRIKGRPDHYFVLSIALNRKIESPRVVEAVEPRPGRWTHHLILSDPEDLDEALKGWLLEAYHFAIR